jgi:signal transduction histidine kinase
MKYSIRQLSFALLTFLGLIGIVLVLVFGILFYRFTVERVVEERAITLQTIANTVGSSFWVHQELLHIPGTVENFLAQTAKIEDIVFIRIVNPQTKTIEKSSDRAEIGKQITRNLPPFAEHISVHDGVFQNSAIKELTIISNNRDHLWMGVSLQQTQQNIILSSVLLGIGVFALFSVAGLLILLLFDRLITIPLITLMGAFHQIEKGRYGIQLKKIPATEMGNVFRSFNKTVQEIRKARERDTLVSNLKTEFIGITTHQLRTPLSILKWILSTLSNGDYGKISKKQKEVLSKATATNQRMMALIDDLLHTVEIEEGRFQYSFDPTSIVDVIENVVSDLTEIAKQKNITIRLLRPRKQPPLIALDTVKFPLALTNIIENAISYTKKGGTITINISQEQHNLILSVQDTGIGIDQKDIQRLFTKFFRGQRATLENTVGNGLGLFIVKNIVEAHGGHVWVESEVNKGTTVYISLPLKT